MLVAGLDIIRQARAMQMAKVFGHQHREFGTDHLFNRVTENLDGGGVHKEDGAVFVNSYDCVGSSFGNDARVFDDIVELNVGIAVGVRERRVCHWCGLSQCLRP
jgi:hypothetical protein